MYEVFLLCTNRTVSLQLMMNILRCIVLSRCIYRVSNCSLSVIYHCWSTTESPGKMFWGSSKVLEFFCEQESGNPEFYFMCNFMCTVLCCDNWLNFTASHAVLVEEFFSDSVVSVFARCACTYRRMSIVHFL